MSRLDHLPPRDLERLSAYLDGDLTSQEAAQLRARLEADPELRLSLAEMRQVVTALHGLGEVRVPRSFALGAADVARRGEPRFVVLRLATVLATALFVLTTVARTASGIRLQFGAAAPAAQSATTAEQEMFANVAGAALPTSAVLLEVSATPAPTDVMPVPAGTAVPAPTLAAAAGLTSAPTATRCPSCAPSADRQAGEELQADDTAEAEAALPAETLAESLGSLNLAQWILGAAAVVLGILTVRARRRR